MPNATAVLLAPDAPIAWRRLVDVVIDRSTRGLRVSLVGCADDALDELRPPRHGQGRLHRRRSRSPGTAFRLRSRWRMDRRLPGSDACTCR